MTNAALREALNLDADAADAEADQLFIEGRAIAQEFYASEVAGVRHPGGGVPMIVPGNVLLLERASDLRRRARYLRAEADELATDAPPAPAPAAHVATPLIAINSAPAVAQSEVDRLVAEILASAAIADGSASTTLPPLAAEMLASAALVEAEEEAGAAGWEEML